MKTTPTCLIGLAVTAVGLAQPTITTQPKNQSVSLGATVTFDVRANGISPLSYQWRHNDAALPDATGISLALTNVQLVNAGTYTVVVTDEVSSTTSQPAILDVDPAFTKITAGSIVTDQDHSFACAWEDYDRDGFLDLFVGNGGILAIDGARQKNSLYHNSGNGTFEKITAGSLVNDLDATLNVAWADFDNDGNPDVFVGNFLDASGWLYLNNGASGFTPISRTNFTPDPAHGVGAAWADFDGDGWLDLFVGRGGNFGLNNVLYQNNGAGALIGITTNSLFQVRNYAISAAWSDYDGDGDLDLFTPNWRAQGNPAGNVFYRNDGQGSFTNVSQESGLDARLDTRGCAWADFDNDGDLDLFAANADWLGASLGTNQANCLYRNDGNGTFTKIVQGVVVTDRGNSEGGAWGDYDNDGRVDLFVVDIPGNNRLYHNEGDGAFSRVVSGSLVNDGGRSQACAWGDYDNDGFLDLFVANQNNQPNFLYRNSGNSNAWIKVRCVGTVSNRSAIGGKVRLKAIIGGELVEQLREITGGDGRRGQTLIAHFGLGNATLIDTLRIEWPSGIAQEFHAVAPRQFVTITEPAQLQGTGAGVFRIQSWKGMAFEIQASTDLEQWSPVDTATNLTGTLEFTDPHATNRLRRFYRTVLR